LKDDLLEAMGRISLPKSLREPSKAAREHSQMPPVWLGQCLSEKRLDELLTLRTKEPERFSHGNSDAQHLNNCRDCRERFNAKDMERRQADTSLVGRVPRRF